MVHDWITFKKTLPLVCLLTESHKVTEINFRLPFIGQMKSYHGPWLNNNVEGNNFIDYDSIERNFIDQISRLAKINNNALAQRAPMGKRRRGTQYTHCRRDLQNYFFIIFFEEFPNIHVSMFLCYRSNWLFSDILIDLDLWICML